MSVKVRAKSVESNVVRGLKTGCRDVMNGMARAGTSLKHGARVAGPDAKKAGKRVSTATRRGLTRAGNRVRSGHRAKPNAA